MSIRDHLRHHDGLFSRLHRYPKRGWVAGVCAGLAEYFDWNVKLIRVLFVAAVCFGGGTGFVVYAVLWYLMDVPDSSATTSGPGPQPSGYSSHASGRAPTTTDVKARFAGMEERLRNMEECVASSEFELRRELKKLES